MSNENYIVINGKESGIDRGAIRQLGISVEVKKETPFARHFDEFYCYIDVMNDIKDIRDRNDDFDNCIYDNVNYFNDHESAQQVALHQLLYRKLLKYAYENDAIVDDWTSPHIKKYFIAKNTDKNKLFVDWDYRLKQNCVVYFTSEEVAEQAIKDVVEPFMKEHPEFIW